MEKKKADKKHQLSEESLKTSREFAHVNKVAPLLFRALSPLVRNRSGKLLYNDLCSRLIAITGTGPTELKGQRKIIDGDLTLLRGFKINRDRRLSLLMKMWPEVYISTENKSIEIEIPPLNKYFFNAPPWASKVALVFQCILLDVVNYTIETIPVDDLQVPLNDEGISGKKIKIPIKNTEGKVITVAMGIGFYIKRLDNIPPGISNDRNYIAGEILEAVYIKNGKIVTFSASSKENKSHVVVPVEEKRIPWTDVE